MCDLVRNTRASSTLCHKWVGGLMAGVEQDGVCFQQLYVSWDFGETWAAAVEFIQQYDWGPQAPSPSCSPRSGSRCLGRPSRAGPSRGVRTARRRRGP